MDYIVRMVRFKLPLPNAVRTLAQDLTPLISVIQTRSEWSPPMTTKGRLKSLWLRLEQPAYNVR